MTDNKTSDDDITYARTAYRARYRGLRYYRYYYHCG